MSAVAKVETMQIPVQNQSTAEIAMIERAVRDVSIPLDRLEKMLELRDRIKSQDNERAFDSAMTLAQSEMRPVVKDSSNSQTRSKYASYGALDNALRPIYTAHGFSLSFNTGAATESEIEILCDVAHRDGHKRAYKIPMPRDGKGAKGGDVMTKTHATGSAATYGRRYLLQMIFNIVTGDDDGNSAGAAGGEVVSDEQLKQILTRMRDSKVNAELYCSVMKIERVEDTLAKDFNTAMRHLDDAAKYNNKGAK